MDNDVNEVTILDKQSEPGTPGTKLLRFTLKSTPSEAWVHLFHDATPLRTGTFNFLHSHPEVRHETIMWSVPVEDEAAAVAYVEQSLHRANELYSAGSNQRQGDEAEQARQRREADDAAANSRLAGEKDSAQQRLDADSAGIAERRSDGS